MLHRLVLAFAMIAVCSQISPAPALQAQDGILLHEDAFYAPRPAHASRAVSATADRYTPSAYLAGSVAVRLVLPESETQVLGLQENWSEAEIARLERATHEAFAWWAARVPQAHVTFQIVTQVVPIEYEPITHSLSTEGRWIGAALTQLGFSGSDHFEQAYSANQALRRELATDWATTIFIANSAADADNQFADGSFAYAYVNGPFTVLTSEAGGYGAGKLAHMLTHELGHIFGALDQYAAAGIPCTAASGYLAIAATNSQANSCGTHHHSIMWEPVSAFEQGAVDTSALGQVGYHDSDGDAIPDPLDTEPTLTVNLTPQLNQRPQITARAADQPFKSPLQRSISLNSIDRVEFRTNTSEWLVLPPGDGSYDTTEELIHTTLALYDGTHTVELRAVNRVGTASRIITQTITISGVGAAPVYNLVIPDSISAAAYSLQLDLPTNFDLRSSESAGMTTGNWHSVLLPVWGEATSDHIILFLQLRDQTGLETPIHRRTIQLTPAPQPPTNIVIFVPLAVR
ncbi:MAG: hypothetical protein H7Z42_11120 [Roseiflexaceae bacterium]|nr:hypothetical protein [Roseiflexaceae bacterium]